MTVDRSGSVTRGARPTGHAAVQAPTPRKPILMGERRTIKSVRPRARERRHPRKHFSATTINSFLMLFLVVFGFLIFLLAFSLFRPGSEGRPSTVTAAAAGSASSTGPDGGMPASLAVAGPAGCVVDTDCDQGQSCRAPICLDDLFAGTECHIDHDCRVGEACRDGSCVPGPDSGL